jgi:RNA polymerase sigma factor (TIGR02999 family)
MDGPASSEVSRLLEQARDGDPGALNRLSIALYRELQRLARQHLRGQRRGQSLRTTDLVHEAYLKLAKLNEPEWKNRIQFLSLASLAMRSLLVDYARRRGYAKRGANPIRVSLADAPGVSEPSTEVLAVDEALKRLSKLDSRKSQIVQLRYFGGLSIEETAEVMAISTGTVKREWTKAEAWLRRELRRGQLR